MGFEAGAVAERCQFAVGDCIDSRWRVEAFLGEGTFGQVFRVTDSRGGRYALKLLKLWEVPSSERPNLIQRFKREYETGRIQSPYLVHSVTHGSVKGNVYIVMEYCSGGDLIKAMEGNRRVDLVTVARHVLLGLRDLHVNGKVHRDLKPENVLMRDATHAVLTDFGISGDRNNRLTQRGWSGVPKQLFGTIAYMPPEQINPRRDNATVLPTTDIFSFGVMMFQLLTGELPFGRLVSDSDVPAYAANGKNGRWNRSLLRGVDNADCWTTTIEGCLKPDFKTRLQTIDDVLPLLPCGADGPVMPDRGAGCGGGDFCRDVSRGMVLRVMQGEDAGRIYNLTDLFAGKSTVINVGRFTPDVWNNLAIIENESAYISRRHCSIVKDPFGSRWVIRDGQYRTRCPIGLRLPYMFPCRSCSAVCPKNGGELVWTGSLNGTFVNSSEVGRDGVELHPGDIISIGDVKMRVEGLGTD